jgi:hypothetical protein
MTTFEQYLDSLQPPLSKADKLLELEWHEIRERHALCRRMAEDDIRYYSRPHLSDEQADILIRTGQLPKTGTQIPKMGNVIKGLNTRISVLEKMLEANPVMTKTGEIKEVRL